ncbi:MAG: AgmX/PglI C-terminal domain-containing protein, partial [Myxococcota bacterium]
KGVSGAGPGIQDLLSSGGSAGDLDEALARAGGVRAAQEGEDIRGPAGGDGDRRSDIGDLATKGAGEVERKGRGETRIRGALRQGNIEADTATVDSEQLGRFIRSRQQAIQACYENELRRNPQLRGRLLVHIVIGRTGRVSAIDFLEDTVGSTAVLNCVRSRIRTWSFPVRPPEETPISVPFIFTPAG